MSERPPIPVESAPDPPVIRWILLVCRLVQIGLVTWIVIELPLPILDAWLPVKNVVAALLGVAGGGKCLYDTLFYDRYWP